MAAVANVNAAKYGTSVSIFWIAPFSLDVTDVAQLMVLLITSLLPLSGNSTSLHTLLPSQTQVSYVCVYGQSWDGIIVFSGPILQSKSNDICVKGNVSIVHTAVMDVASYFLKYTVKVNTRIVFLYKHQISSFNSTKSVTPLLFKAHLLNN